MTWQQRPGYKRGFCDALPVRMRLAGWSERECLMARAYAHAVADVYTGNGWRNFARDVDNWLAKTPPGDGVRLNCTIYLPRFPRRSGVLNHFLERTPS